MVNTNDIEELKSLWTKGIERTYKTKGKYKVTSACEVVFRVYEFDKNKDVWSLLYQTMSPEKALDYFNKF